VHAIFDPAHSVNNKSSPGSTNPQLVRACLEAAAAAVSCSQKSGNS
jgi:hypothetical protein